MRNRFTAALAAIVLLGVAGPAAAPTAWADSPEGGGDQNALVTQNAPERDHRPDPHLQTPHLQTPHLQNPQLQTGPDRPMPAAPKGPAVARALREQGGP
jgi:hypothetical protein